MKNLRPAAVKFALILSLLSFGEAMFEDVAAVHGHDNSDYIRIAIRLIIFLILLLFIFLGMNWARWVFVLLSLAGICVEVYFIIQDDFRFSTFWFVRFFIHTLIYLAVIIALFLPSSDKWFKKHSNTDDMV